MNTQGKSCYQVSCPKTDFPTKIFYTKKKILTEHSIDTKAHAADNNSPTTDLTQQSAVRILEEVKNISDVSMAAYIHVML